MSAVSFRFSDYLQSLGEDPRPIDLERGFWIRIETFYEKISIRIQAPQARLIQETPSSRETKVERTAPEPFSFSDYLQAQFQPSASDRAARENSLRPSPRDEFRAASLAPSGLSRFWRTSILENRRVALIKEILTSPEQQSEAERAAFGQVKLATWGVALGAAGLLFFPLQLVSIACSAPFIAGEFKAAWQHVTKEMTRCEQQVT